jgi:ArsR family transcriptional regulator
LPLLVRRECRRVGRDRCLRRVRLRLLSLITTAGGEVCACDLTAAFDLTQPTISHHLKVLREAGLVDSQRRGTWVYHWPRPESLKQLSVLLDTPGLAPV